MSMNVDSLLNLERRTGIKNTEIDDFVRKTTEVEAALKGLLDGTINPDEIHIDGIETEEEKKKKELEREEKRRQYREKEEKLRLQRKKEEISRWWSGAEIYKPKNVENNQTEATDEFGKPSVLTRYTADYSKWDSWVPTDEATKEEEAIKFKQEEDIKNKEFEKNNPEFCQQFVSDMEQRKKSMKEKEESSNILRLKGNRYFKAKDYQRALELYMDALKDCPFDSKLLLNIAQAHIKLKNNEDALEFIKRTLYIEETNVKALSRKAFVLSEQGHYGDALEAINTALKYDSNNIELITQQKELFVMKEEKQSEQRLQELKEVTEKLKSANIATEKAIEETSEVKQLRQIDAIKKACDELNNLLKSNPPSAEITGNLKSLNEHLFEAVKFVANNSILVAHIRQSDSLLSIITSVKLLWDHWQKNIKTGQSDAQTTAILESQFFQSINLLYEFINASVDGQRSSKQLVVDQKLYTVSKQILEIVQESSLVLCAKVIHHIHLLCKDTVCAKARALIFSDTMTLQYISHLVGNVIHNLQRKVYSFFSATEDEKLNSLSITYKMVQDCFSIMKLMMFSENPTDKALITNLTASTSLPLFFSFGQAGFYFFQQSSSFKLLKNPSTTLQQLHSTIEENLQYFVELMVGFSQYETIRRNCATEITVEEPSNTVNGKLTTSITHNLTIVSVVLDIVTKYPQYLANGLGILMNASLEPEGVVKQKIADKAEGRQLAFSCLEIAKAKDVKKVDLDDGLIAARKAGLLSRIATVPSILAELSQAAHYQLLCKFLKIPISYGEELPKWLQDQHGHFVRLLASLPPPTAENKVIAHKEGILQSLLALFPMPRMECGEITPLSVTLVPANPASAQILGNAARCLMPYADDLTYATMLYNDANLFGVEKLICAMATCVDMRVRKNIAILLAKGCRVPGVREKVTKFRGLQMMIELQDKL